MMGTLQDRLRTDPHAVSHGLRYEAADALDAQRADYDRLLAEYDALERQVANEHAANVAILATAEKLMTERDQWKARAKAAERDAARVAELLNANPNAYVSDILACLNDEAKADAMKEQP